MSSFYLQEVAGGEFGKDVQVNSWLHNVHLELEFCYYTSARKFRKYPFFVLFSCLNT